MKLSADILKKIYKLMKDSHLVVSKDALLEIYHHTGAENFIETGAVFIKVVNKEYCKSYAILLPGQAYPNHYHKIKKETFFVLYGELDVNCDDKQYSLLPGELLSIERGENHAFSTSVGAVFEELSTTYVQNDSIYEDEAIRKTTYSERKTLISLEEFYSLIDNE